MNVLHVVTKSEHGGAQTHVWQLALHLKTAGHVVQITSHPGGWLEDQAKANGVPFHPNVALSNSLSVIRGLAAGRSIAGLIRKLQPDVVHCHSSAAGFWARLAIKGTVPTVFTAHGWGFTPGAPRLRSALLLAVERGVSRYTSRYICVSEQDAQLARRHRIGATSGVTVIHNGIELQDSTARTGPVQGVVRAIFVGRMARPKQPEELIAALSELPTSVQDKYEVRMVGDGRLARSMQRLAAHSRVNAHLLGALPRDEVIRQLGASDVFVHISKYEGLPISILEAMSMGLAVIASDVGGVREAITPECGILLPRSDREALKRALTRLAGDPGAIERYGSAARARARSEFSGDVMCEKTLAVYRDVIRR